MRSTPGGEQSVLRRLAKYLKGTRRSIQRVGHGFTWAAWAAPRGARARRGPSGTPGGRGRCRAGPLSGGDAVVSCEGRRPFRPARRTAQQALVGTEVDRAGHDHHHAVEAPAPPAARKLGQQLLPGASEQAEALARGLHGQLGRLGRRSGSSAGRRGQRRVHGSVVQPGRPVPVASALAWAYLKYTESGLEMSKECRAVGLPELLPRVRQRRRRLARDEADC